MEIQVYPIEKYHRTLQRKVMATIVVILLLAMVVYGGNFIGPTSRVFVSWSGVGSAIFLLLLGGAYRYFHNKILRQTVSMYVDDEGLSIGDTLYDWSELTGFDVEMNSQTSEYTNIVLLIGAKHRICSFDAPQQDIQTFVEGLQKYLTMTNEYPVSVTEKLMRRWKI